MKKKVKLILILVVLVSGAFLFESCSKEDEDPGEYFMRFKANGTLVEYTNQLGLSAGFAQSGNQYVGTISGWNDASTNFSLLLYNQAPITESTYSGYAVSVNGTVGVLFAHKEKESGDVFSSGVTADYDARVTLSEITETGVKGTFSGLIKAAGHPDITITEGSFFVKRVLN
jgi:hypothetical protein